MTTVKVKNYADFRAKLLRWAATFSDCVFLEDAINKTVRVGVGVEKRFANLDILPDNEWLFGYITYDYKNKIEDLVSENPETISFDCIHFFSPELVLFLDETGFYIEKGNLDIHALVQKIQDTVRQECDLIACNLKPVLTKRAYISKVKALQNHIRQGNIYEVNFCQEFAAESVLLTPTAVYDQLLKASPMPFAVFMKQGGKYALCSSPERYIQKIGDKIISQPIKGTAKRGANAEEDAAIIQALKQNPKERAENVMAVDVVRNDFARVAVSGTVAVEELCEVYTFKQLHQMISTVSAIVPQDKTFSDLIEASFPMASMTGAPKIRAMQLIETYETCKRGLYSGTIGYLSPTGDFDSNVVIRTILYDKETQQLSFTVGSAITAEADAEKEYEECLLKAEAIKKALMAN